MEIIFRYNLKVIIVPLLIILLAYRMGNLILILILLQMEIIAMLIVVYLNKIGISSISFKKIGKCQVFLNKIKLSIHCKNRKKLR